MPVYHYKAVDAEGKVIKAEHQADNELELEDFIEKESLDLISYRIKKTSLISFEKQKLERKEIISMVIQLEQLTKSGVPLIEGLKDLRDSYPKGYFKKILSQLVTSIEGGKTFSEALQEFEKDFDTTFVALIAIGEESGELPKILKDMGVTFRWLDELMGKMTKILIYPAIVATIVLIVTVFLMVFLVPDIVSFVQDMGTNIPLHTKALIATSNFIINFWWLLLALVVSSIVLPKILAKKFVAVATYFDSIKLKLPIVGDAMLKIKLARFASYMALLYASGITILRSLDICRALMSNKVIENAIDNVKAGIAEGKSISQSFEEAKFFPALVVRMVKVGENTGNMDEALHNVNDFFNQEVDDAINKIEPSIGPVLTVIMGVASLPRTVIGEHTQRGFLSRESAPCA